MGHPSATVGPDPHPAPERERTDVAIHPVDATLEAAKIDPDQRAERLKGVKLDGAGWKYALTRALKEFGNDGGTDLAAKLTYYLVLSLAPSLLAVFSILSLVLASNRGAIDDLLGQLTGLVPSDYQPLVTNLVTTMSESAGSGGGIIALIIGIATALWSASAYVKAFNRSANTVYGYEEGRGLVKLTLTNLLTTLILIVGIAVVLLSLALNRSLVDGFLQPIAGPLGMTGVVNFLSDTFLPVWAWVKWPVVVLILLVLIATLYYTTPNVQKPRFHLFGPGNIVALVGMVLAAVALSVYFTQFAGYSAYGAIGTIMALLFALWIFNIVLLLGLEVDTEVERALQLEAGLPAEARVQLPPKDVAAVEKRAEKQTTVEERGYELRAVHEGR